MTEGNGNTPAPGADGQTPQAQVKMQILAQFIRDMSFENVLAQKGVQGEVLPEIQVKVALDAKKRSAEHQYEVILKFTVTSRTKEKAETLFLLELDYGGVFHVEGIPEQQLHPFLLIECPRMLFPFVRRIVSDVTRDGGFPPVNLDMVDFLAIYKQQAAQRAQTQAAEEPTQ